MGGFSLDTIVAPISTSPLGRSVTSSTKECRRGAPTSRICVAVCKTVVSSMQMRGKLKAAEGTFPATKKPFSPRHQRSNGLSRRIPPVPAELSRRWRGTLERRSSGGEHSTRQNGASVKGEDNGWRNVTRIVHAKMVLDLLVHSIKYSHNLSRYRRC